MKISLAVSAIGLIALWFLSAPQTINIADVRIGEQARIAGVVEKVFVSAKGNVFLTVSDGTGEISVVLFNSHKFRKHFERDQLIEATGMIKEYKGKTEIIAREIKVLSG